MFNWKLWDRTSLVNGASAEAVLKDLKAVMASPNEAIYLIFKNEQVIGIQTDSRRPYKDCTIEECAQRDCDEREYALNNPPQNIETEETESEITT